MSLYSQKVPSKVLNTKESLFLKGLQTAVAATDSEDVLLTISASFRQAFFATSQKIHLQREDLQGLSFSKFTQLF